MLALVCFVVLGVLVKKKWFMRKHVTPVVMCLVATDIVRLHKVKGCPGLKDSPKSVHAIGFVVERCESMTMPEPGNVRRRDQDGIPFVIINQTEPVIEIPIQ